MKTKIIVFNAIILVLFGCVVAWGQFHPTTGRNTEPSVQKLQKLSNPNQSASPNLPSYQDEFFEGLTNLTRFELETINRERRLTGYGRHFSAAHLGISGSNYNQLTEDQKYILDILFRASKEVKSNLHETNYLEKLKASKLKENPVLHPWRKINGKTVYILSPDSAFINCAGTVIQTLNGGVLVRPLVDIAGNYFIKNFPFQVADGYELDSSKFMASRVGLTKLTTVLGAERTITELDYGVPCERPKGGEIIEAEAKAPKQMQIQNIELSIKEMREAAARADSWIADFIQKIENDKIIAVEKEKQRKIMAVEKEKQRQELIKETAKNKLIKNLQDMADKGDKYGLLYMGERYRDGDGVPKDLNKARDYLSKAAAAGSLTAADELKKLPTK